MDKYLLEAYWSAAQSAVEDRNVESLGRIVDCIKGLGAEAASDPVEESAPAEPRKATTKARMPYGTTSAARRFIDKNNLFGKFVTEALAQEDSFTPNQFRLWLKEHCGEEFDSAVPSWEPAVGTLLRYYSSPENDFYMGVKRVGSGRYTLLPQYRGMYSSTPF